MNIFDGPQGTNIQCITCVCMFDFSIIRWGCMVSTSKNSYLMCWCVMYGCETSGALWKVDVCVNG